MKSVKNTNLYTKFFGLALIILGIFGASISGGICTNMCSDCLAYEISPCYSIMAFVGIILIINGASIIILHGSNKEIKNNRPRK